MTAWHQCSLQLIPQRLYKENKTIWNSSQSTLLLVGRKNKKLLWSKRLIAMDSIGTLWMVTYLSMLSMLIPFSTIMAIVIKTGKVYVLQVHENRYTFYLSHTFHQRPSKGLLLQNNLWTLIICSVRTWYLLYDGTNHNHTREKLIIHLLPSWGKFLEKRDHFLIFVSTAWYIIRGQ